MNIKDLPAQHGLEILFNAQRQAFSAQPMPGAALRREWLAALAGTLKSNAVEIAAAIDTDFGGRPHAETRLLELFPALESICYARARLAAWMRPERCRDAPDAGRNFRADPAARALCLARRGGGVHQCARTAAGALFV